MAIRLSSIQFLGFQSVARIARVDFSADQTSIIFGTNGCGKTTFLKLMHAVLSKDESVLLKENVYSAIVSYCADGEEFEVAIPGFMRAGEPDGKLEYDWGEFDLSHLAETRSLSLGVERGVQTQPISVEAGDIYRFLTTSPDMHGFQRQNMVSISERLADHLNRQSVMRRNQLRKIRTGSGDLQLERKHAFLQNIKIDQIELLLLERYRRARDYASEKVQSALFDTLSMAIDDSVKQTPSTFPEDFGNQLISGKDRIIEALNDGPENNFKDRVVAVLESVKSVGDVGLVTSNVILASLVWNMLKELQLEKMMLSSINFFVDIFNDFLGPGKSIEVTPGGVYLNVVGNAKPVGVDSLSSGERHLFTFLALVLIAAQDRDFLIIDEPEISLNALWQRNLVNLLQDLAPVTQIILASHSPVLAKGRTNCLVELKPEFV